jgi:hypothetical protein
MQPTLFDRFDLPLRIAEALPNHKHVEPIMALVANAIT